MKNQQVSKILLLLLSSTRQLQFTSILTTASTAVAFQPSLPPNLLNKKSLLSLPSRSSSSSSSSIPFTFASSRRSSNSDATSTSTSTSANADSNTETNDEFILENFEHQSIQQNALREMELKDDRDGVISLNTCTNVNDGKVVGPAHVLVYDTSLRGMYIGI